MPKQTAVLAKKSLQFSPIGPFLSMSGTIFIDRGNNAKAIRSIDAAGKHMMSTKTSLLMFPEGTRFLSKEPDMLPLKKGGFHLAVNAGIPIIPIVVENYWHLYRPGVFESGIVKIRGKKVWLNQAKQLINAFYSTPSYTDNWSEFRRRRNAGDPCSRTNAGHITWPLCKVRFRAVWRISPESPSRKGYVWTCRVINKNSYLVAGYWHWAWTPRNNNRIVFVLGFVPGFLSSSKWDWGRDRGRWWHGIGWTADWNRKTHNSWRRSMTVEIFYLLSGTL